MTDFSRSISFDRVKSKSDVIKWISLPESISFLLFRYQLGTPTVPIFRIEFSISDSSLSVKNPTRRYGLIFKDCNITWDKLYPTPLTSLNATTDFLLPSISFPAILRICLNSSADNLLINEHSIFLNKNYASKVVSKPYLSYNIYKVKSLRDAETVKFILKES